MASESTLEAKSAHELGSVVTAADLAPFFGGDLVSADYFAGAAEWVAFPAEATIARQFSQAEYIYILVEGGITFGIHLEESGLLFQVGDTARPWTPIGWSGLRPPGRYSATIQTTAQSRFLRWPAPDLWRLLYSNPRQARVFAERLAEGGLTLLDATRKGIGALGRGRTVLSSAEAPHDRGESGARVGSPFDGGPDQALGILAASPFFREFTDLERNFFASAAQFLRVRRGDRILVQGSDPDGLYVLVRGQVTLNFRPEGSGHVVSRAIGTEGAVFNWCGIDRPHASPFTVEATRDTVVIHIPAEAIAREADRNPEFGFVYTQRVLWLLGQMLLSARARMISQQAENEIQAVASLIEQKATELPLRSSLYKIPHLLSHPNTRQDAFDTLHRLVISAGPLERGLAGLALHILTDLERETRFRNKLAFIYERVAGADPTETRAALLQESADGMMRAFEEAPYVVEGIENLPHDSGFVAIYNHLACNKDYQLPNNFEFTLDSHFVSTLLMRRFGTPGLRIVKTSDGDEFWHHGYYGRILTIGVSASQSRGQRARFYQTVQNTLAARTPVVIAPEGINNTANSWTEASPGPFQPGAFVLATRMTPEPWIVPIALANFDKSVRNSVYAAVIKPPFRMSDHVSDPTDRAAMSRFIDEYRHVFAGYVREASALAEEVRHGGALRPRLISNVERLDWLDGEFADDVNQLEHRVRSTPTSTRPVAFYGSSSFRLWDAVGADLGLDNVLNLGFGGSTLEACAHFFERIVVPHHPSALFVYAGDNDIGNGASAEQVIDRCAALFYKIDQFLPGLPVRMVSIKPSPYRADRTGPIERANQGIAALCAVRPDTQFIDIFPAMLRADGAPDESLFTEDMLHMNADGYARWTAALRPAAGALARSG